MSNMSQRGHRRYPVKLPLLHMPESPKPDGTWVGWTRDLSEEGACVELDRSVAAPTHLWVRLHTDRGAIEVKAGVVWVGEPLTPEAGILHGLAFIQMSTDQLEALRYVLYSWGITRWNGVRLPFEVAVTCQPKGEAAPPLHAQARDVSRAGLLLRLPQVVPPGRVLELTLHARRRALTANGAVVWVAPLEGRTPGSLIRHGLRFTPLDWSTSLALAQNLVGQLEETPWLSPQEGNG
jgi:hypothetical protein